MENRVVCIKPYKSILTVNKVYEVKREHDDTLVIVGDDSIRYVMPRAYFKEVSVIKKVRYTKESCAYVPNMRIGDVYEVVKETKDGFYIVINSNRITARVPKSCFEEIKKVICIRTGANKYITIGKEYEVLRYCEKEQEYKILNDIGQVHYYCESFFIRPFTPIKDNPTITTGGNIHITGEGCTITRDNGIWEDNIPKKVVCVNTAGHKNITVGKEYEVLGGTENRLSIVNDKGGTTFMYRKHLFKPIKSNRNISVNLTFDTTELQAKLEKALYHLKELNKVMDEIGDGDVKVKVGK